MASTATFLFAHGGGFCKEVWEPIMRRLKGSPLLQGTVSTRFVNFDFKYHGGNRDESEKPQVDLSNPSSPRVHHSAGDLTTWTSTEVLQRVRALQSKYPDGPLIGIGHSMGACALWNTEVQCPGTFDGLILFEPVYGDMNVSMVTDFLVSITLKRESSWSSRAAAEEHLRSFKNFSAWDRESLEAYMKGGLVEDKSTGKTVLACSPPMEASLYCHKLMFCTDQQLAGCKSKISIHSGGRSKMFLSPIFETMNKKWPHIYSVGEPIPRCSHALVLEDPAMIAQKILESLGALDLFQGVGGTPHSKTPSRL
ncbi:hypothetical protein BBJ29_005773 [Phytophthora kernoviae]|uniref:AB hydrolase-1 domain-containing protein n=1 Tax=Phytophthora kernoviae TaxID=325452 RepID=A0A3F2RH45_9STRA|nr:hypothetical protein BBJ29_005773 [Phytophthora kernoviae]RLN56800.1 hypothetical protein BBP00_00007800 [Phytophthora kernoviae]